MDFVLFEDRLEHCGDLLQSYRRDIGRYVLVPLFITKSYSAIREEVNLLSSHRRKQIPNSTHLFDLAHHHYNSQISNPIIDAALQCVCQIATFIRYFPSA